MGAWGTGIYQNDTAADLKADFKDWAGLGWPPEDLARGLVAHVQLDWDAPIEEADDSGAWIALADLFHRYALDHAPLFARARTLIEDGTDLALNQAQEMSAADLKRRGKVLDEALARWAKPHPKPRKAKLLKPEPLLFQTGDLVGYRTMAHSARVEPLGQTMAENYSWEPDGYGAFVVLSTAQVFHGMFARYFIAPLLCFDKDPLNLPLLEICYFITEVSIPFKHFRPLGQWSTFTKKDLASIEAEKLASYDLDEDAVARLFPEILTEPVHYQTGTFGCLSMDYSPWGDTVRASIWGEPEDNFGSILAPS
ncbi:MAG: hypothetical protein AAGH68_00730 [Pseudomonadota bacterium]